MWIMWINESTFYSKYTLLFHGEYNHFITDNVCPKCYGVYSKINNHIKKYKYEKIIPFDKSTIKKLLLKKKRGASDDIIDLLNGEENEEKDKRYIISDTLKINNNGIKDNQTKKIEKIQKIQKINCIEEKEVNMINESKLIDKTLDKKEKRKDCSSSNFNEFFFPKNNSKEFSVSQKLKRDITIKLKLNSKAKLLIIIGVKKVLIFIKMKI